MVEQEDYLDPELTQVVDQRIRFVTDRLTFYNVIMTVPVVLFIFFFVLSVFTSDSALGGRFSWIIDVIIASLWIQVFTIATYSFRLVRFIYKKARGGFEIGVSPEHNIRYSAFDGQHNEKYGVYASTARSLFYIALGIILYLISYLFWMNRDRIGGLITEFGSDETKVETVLVLLRPELSNLLSILNQEQLILTLQFGWVILLLYLIIKGFESLTFDLRRINQESYYGTHSLYSEMAGAMKISRDLLIEISGGDLRKLTIYLVLLLLWTEIVTIPSILFLQVLLG